MNDDANKYPTLKSVVDKVNQKQPDEIHLIATPQNVTSNWGSARSLTVMRAYRKRIWSM
jgi:hypothetical protein